jgi:hypothetical protein
MAIEKEGKRKPGLKLSGRKNGFDGSEGGAFPMASQKERNSGHTGSAAVEDL